MARLTDPALGTVVLCEGDLAEHYLSLGWTDAAAEVRPAKAAPEKPANKRRRSN